MRSCSILLSLIALILNIDRQNFICEKKALQEVKNESNLSNIKITTMI